MKKWLEDDLINRGRILYERKFYGHLFQFAEPQFESAYLINEEDDVVLSPDVAQYLENGEWVCEIIDSSLADNVTEYAEFISHAENKLKGVCGIPKPDNL